jgi:hypothetical protein
MAIPEDFSPWDPSQFYPNTSDFAQALLRGIRSIRLIIPQKKPANDIGKSGHTKHTHSIAKELFTIFDIFMRDKHLAETFITYLGTNLSLSVPEWLRSLKTAVN